MTDQPTVTEAPDYCLVLPHYNHADQLIAFLPSLVASGVACIIVDDGSDESQKNAVQAWALNHDKVFIFAHTHNRGKGAAVKTGFTHARSLGFSHAIQIDADGQHAVNDIALFIEHSQKQPQALICGHPVFDASIPKARLYGRKVTDFWVVLETFSFGIKDALCGFRVYPLDEMEHLLDRQFVGSRMNFDTEILVKAFWDNTEIEFIKTKVIYNPSGISHFHYLRDNMLLIKLHVRLLLGMLPRSPKLLGRALNRLLKHNAVS